MLQNSKGGVFEERKRKAEKSVAFISKMLSDSGKEAFAFAYKTIKKIVLQ